MEKVKNEKFNLQINHQKQIVQSQVQPQKVTHTKS